MRTVYDYGTQVRRIMYSIPLYITTNKYIYLYNMCIFINYYDGYTSKPIPICYESVSRAGCLTTL